LDATGIRPSTYHPDDVAQAAPSVLDPHSHDLFSEDAITAIFRMLDRDNSGTLTKEEIKAGLGIAKSFATYHDLDHPCVVGERDNISEVYTTGCARMFRRTFPLVFHAFFSSRFFRTISMRCSNCWTATGAGR